VTTGGGSVSGGGAAAGGTSTAGGSSAAGGSTAGGSTSGGGTAGGSAQTRAFTWSALSYPGNYAVQSVTARGNDVYAVTFTGELLHTTGSSLVRVPNFTFADASDVYLSPSGKVWVIGTRNNSYVCEGNCTDGASYVQKNNASATDWFLGVCGDGEQVFAIAVGTSLEGILLQYSAGAWRRVTTALGVGNVRNCVVAPNGDVWVSGGAGVSKVVNGAATPQPIDLAMQGAARWQWVALTFDGGTVTDGLLVGTQGGYRLARRDTSGTWTALLPGLTGTDLYGVAAIDDHEFLAVGLSMGGPPFMRFADGGLSALTPAPPLLITTDAIWVSSPNEVFVIGQTTSGQRYLYRGVR
jgi:hypothetical protein